MDDHLVVTAPDRYHGEGIKVTLIDWHHEQLENIINMLRGSPQRMVIHVFGHNDSDMRWLLDVCYQSDLVVMNMEHHTAADPIKGSILPWLKSLYFGRKDLADVFQGYIDDPLGATMSWVGKKIDERFT